MNLTRVWRAAAGKPPREIVQHVARRLGARVDVAALEFPLREADVADSRALPAVERRAAAPVEHPRVGWIVVPPGPGSGGHTTLFRMMEAARATGARNTLLFYDRYGGDHDHNVATVRHSWPWLDCEIELVGEDLSSFDAIVASSWPTAHVAAGRRVPGQAVLYFAQDFEPYFYPRGSEYALAEDSYRLPLRTVALGRMVADCLRDELGLEAPSVPFGCDTETYHLDGRDRPRRGVLFYAKRGNDRRGFRLAVQALERFHRLCPDEPIHVYGDAAAGLPFPAVEHGSIPPAQLNELYNTVVAGFALSFTNISLVAEEMLAAGVVPVINDSRHARADLGNPHALWATATPAALAEALAAAVSRADRDAHARVVAGSVTTPGWEHTGAQLAELLQAELRATAGAGVAP